MPDTRISISREIDVALAVSQTSKICMDLGFNETDRQMVTTAASELARNVYRYAKKGLMTLTPIQENGRSGLRIVADDQGPGIENIDEALADHHSTGGTLGLGLPGVRRLMDDFTIESTPGVGTRVTAKKWRD